MSEDSQIHTENPRLPVGFSVPDWKPASLPASAPMVGKYCELERLTTDHVSALYEAYVVHNTPDDWIYLPYGPFESLESYHDWVAQHAKLEDPFFYAIKDTRSNSVVGLASYLRIDPSIGSIEVGHIHFSPTLQRTRAATEAMYLMMKHVFDCGYRRYEWKCDDLNARSRRSAKRLGFQFEGTFRQATMYKGRNRDTAWFSIIDKDWPEVEKGFIRWLSDNNFNDNGEQVSSLEDCRTNP